MFIVQIMIEENILKFIDSISSSDRNDYKNVSAYHIFICLCLHRAYFDVCVQCKEFLDSFSSVGVI